MTQDMRTGRYTRFIVTLLLLLMCGAGKVWADDITVIIDNGITHGTVTSSIDQTSRVVTLTVTPDAGYKTRTDLIMVEKMVNPGKQSAPRRAPGLGTFPVTGPASDPDGWKTAATNYTFTVTSDYDGAYVTVTFVSTTGNLITSLSEIPNTPEGLAGTYELAADVDASGFNGLGEFKGTLDGKHFTIHHLDHPLFASTDGATIRNVNFENVNISTGDANGDAGAVTSLAKGATRIYNCGILPTTTEYDADGNVVGFYGSSISGTGNVGGLVGTLSDNARVINCFSYATIANGNYVGGIVGYNSVASSQSNVATMVMNCMFYGDITGGNTISPVYGGKIIDNRDGGLATYNYYAYSQLKTKAISTGKYNCALAMEERFLNRCEIYRQLLNSNKKLAAIYATGSAANANQMAKWILEAADRQITNPMPYPVLRKREQNKKYPSIINYDAEHAPDSTMVGRLNGGKVSANDGKLTVTILTKSEKTTGGQSWPTAAASDVQTTSLTLIRTDKDTTRFNFNYDKVQLPYYNDVGTGNYTENRVVTGWKITSITGGNPGDYTEGDSWGGYNFADRKCTNKDVYSVSGRVFSQGAYYDVPYGVTAITIEPYWGQAAYVSDQYYDVVYNQVSGKNNNYTSQPVTGLGTQYDSNPDNTSFNLTTQKVYTTIENARASMKIPTSGKTVYDYAVVLVGNVHQAGPLYGAGNTPYTIMSVDLDKDNEPDYSFIFSHYNRQNVSSIRFDFVNVPGTAQAQKPNGATQLLNVSIFNPKGWFEVTNTCNVFITQFEADNSGKTAAPVIFLGGVIDQYTSTKDTEIEKSDYNNRTQYIHLGSNACFKDFGNGTHSDGWYATRHVPVSVTGGDFDGFYLSGVYRPDAQIMDDDAEGYISGGRFKEVAGAAQQMINGNVRFQIYNADITNFYGGGINAEKPITGNVTVDIFNSHVDTYCGGPKFGDMQKGGTTFTTKYSNNKAGTSTGTKEITIAEDGIVTTTATGCAFGKFFGAGYGGASSYKLKYYDQTDKDFTTTSGFTSLITDYNNDRGKYYDGQNNQYKTNYGNKGPGVATDFDYEFFVWSSGIVGARFYVYYTTFSMAKTNNVYSYLTKCTVNENFYGGGSLGVVNGTATSELTDCNVKGSVYGGGYSASIPSVPVRATGFAQIPIFNANSGIFEIGKKNGTDNFKWKNATLPGGGANALVNGEIPTDVNLDNLGAVTGNVSLTIDGKTVADENGVMMKVSGSVYGGGEESGVDGSTEVTVTGGTIGTQETAGGALYGNVYGGGKGKRDNVTAGLVKGSTKVTIQNTTVGETTTVPRIYHNVYGGGAYGSVGDFEYDTTTGMPTGLKTGAATNSGKTQVEIKGGTFGWNGKENGMIFGSSRGDVGAEGAIEDKLAWVYDTEVKIGTSGSGSEFTTPTIMGSVYGGGENGHNYNNSNVYIYSGTIGIPTGTPIGELSGAAYPYRGNVYGGGCGTDKYYSDPTGVENPYDGKGDKYNPLAGIVRGNATVTMSGGHVVRNVYGAGAMGSVGNAENPTTSGKTTINISGGRIGYDGNNNGNVFGAARGEYGTSTAASGLANVRETEVKISYTTTPTADNEGKTAQLITGSVFGGGEAGTVKESVAVNMTGGLILKDVYGGGALADTQTSNWDATANSNAGGWATGKSSSSSTTTVRLTGGRIVEEAYGGGLGEEGKPAFVWGDVLVDLNGTTTKADGKPTANGTPTTSTTGCVVGQVFGGNNVNGTPKGDVMVHVYATQNPNTSAIATKVPLTFTEPATDKVTYWSTQATNVGLTPATVIGTATADADKINLLKAAIEAVRYDVSAVYGGGNKAAYVPVSPYTTSNTSGAKTQVIIEGCSTTSIETVYGGGNAAAVPETNVEVRSAYEIGYVFGGGNGYSATNNHTNPSAANYNPGADIGVYKEGSTEHTYGTGNANAILKGGFVHEAYGGSNQMGQIKGNVNINTAPIDGGCDLCVDKLVGAGKNADVDGDLIMILGCKPTTKTPLVFAGADNADVNGNVELTITSGTFGQVFGGNNLGGAIKGHIKLNIEETGCNPIVIDELYLGGNQAAYSRYGYYLDTSDNKVKPRTAAMHAITDPNATGYVAPLTNPTEDATHTFPYAQPELNVISCTSIGKVFGGGLGTGAVMHADPTVNINMIPGAFASQLGGAHALGAIGDVYGGGNAASVIGNTTVNIGTGTTVTLTSIDDNPATTEVNESVKTVLGANITGNVFGGGNEANVSGNTYVNICGTQIADSNSENGYTDTSVDHTGTTGFAVSIGNSVYGGGNAADVEGNTFVTFADGYVFNGIFGGGLAGSVGTFTKSTNVTDWGHTANHAGCIGKPISCTAGGTCYVVVSGGQIGPIEVATQGQGMNRLDADGGPVPQGWVWGAGCGLVEDPATHPDTHFKAYVNNTDVTIKGNAFILESIIGGGEFGRVLGNTLVKIKGGQIGVGEGMVADGKPVRYTDGQFVDPTTTTITTGLATCSHFPFGKEVGGKKVYECYDPYADAYKTAHSNSELYPGGVTDNASDGKTWIGCVFGGGSGYMPYINKNNNVITDYDWVPSAGWVEGNTEVRISGGHILTNVYGGNEYTDVKGTSKVKMTGGTVGVPRTKEQIEALPMCGYIYGAGKGDERTHFNTATNVGSAEVEISGGIVYGSVYGGGEDGHVLGNVTVTIKDGAKIGTCGTSYFDGHVFGGGRGFSGIAQTAGTVGGNVTLNIEGGTMLGSVYGGGRLASVGTHFTAPNDNNYGNFKEDDTNGTYGHVTLSISGGTIGKQNVTGNGAQYSGNVFGGSMGRLTKLDGDTITIWPKMAQVKSTAVNISGNNTVICRSVFGGGELGTVRDDAYVTIGGQKTADADANGDVAVTASGSPTIRRDVYGGGYGSDKKNHTIFSVKESGSNNTYAFTPMQFAGCVGKNTYVNVVGGYIRKSVYGGGEMASVGVINCLVDTIDTTPAANQVVIKKVGSKSIVYRNMVKHSDATTQFALSWPYKFNYVDGYPGATHVKIKGGRLGLKNNDSDNGFEDNGDVYGAGKGQAGEFKDYLFCANVGSTDVEIEYPSTLDAYSGTADLIAGAVYGGGEDGHVMGNTKVTLKEGFVYHSIYGAGSGKGKYNGRLLKIGATEGSTNENDYYNRSVYSITAGKVFGNTEVTMSGGRVIRNVYGGGNMGSVGKGNYAGGSGDYSEDGYGEKVSNLWSNNDFLNSGKCTVKISGGTIGYIDTTTPSNSMYPFNSPAGLPYGNVFGGCRGEAAPDLDVTPSYLYSPEFFMGYVNETEVTIEGANTKILGSVYGGGMDGHVRRDASVTVKGGEIGLPFTDANKTNVVKTSDPDNIQWLARGNVYGAGSGIGEYNAENIQYKTGYTGTQVTGTGNSTSAGSVTRFTKVDIQGGTIHRNVYGGGSLASIGAPKIGQTYNEYRKGDTNHTEVGKQTLNEVVISGGHIGGDYSYSAGNHVYGGHVFGGSRGDASLNATKFSTSMFTSVTINPNTVAANSPVIEGSVFGGGEVGIVKGSVDVNINGGTINDDVYGGGALANTNTENPSNSTSTYTTTVNLYGGLIKGDAYGGGLGRLAVTAVTGVKFTQAEIDAAQEGDDAYGKTTNDWKVAPVAAVSAVPALVYGNVAVNLGNADRTAATAFDVNKYTGGTHDGIVKSGRVFGCNNLNGSPQGTVTVTVNKTVKGNTDKTASGDIKSEDATKHSYHVAAVYGGGNLAGKTVGGSTNVIINGCDVSIRDVYGGGNAAAVPATDVLVNGSYEIEHVFGGGNGKDDYTLNGGTTWTTNPGANVNGNTNTLLLGGLIHEAYGGSNEKGTITGSVSINTASGQPADCSDCPLDVEKIVGAGKNADVEGNLIMVLGCKPTTKTPLVFGGADNANVNGNVELTITSGTFGKVFGGNNLGGVIKGHIILNIEETGCNPINIDELYLGGNQAAYSRYGYYNAGTTENPNIQPRTAAMHAITNTSDPNYKAPITNPSNDDQKHPFPYAQPELNVISCTSIGKVFGGGLGAGAIMHADPTVNINMVPGAFASQLGGAHALGAIGDVYGGGNAADVYGDATVNIGTATKVRYHQSVTNGVYTMSDEMNVEGANITGDVFGGGYSADVKGNTQVNICAVKSGDTYKDVTIAGTDYHGVKILGSVYGGGDLGSVGTFTYTDATHNGKNPGSVLAAGKPTGFTANTGKSVVAIMGNAEIGFDNMQMFHEGVDPATDAPDDKGHVFGAGKGKLEAPSATSNVEFISYVDNTVVTIGGNAFVKGSVYGGSENGHVLHDTYVNIQGGQIGCGKNTTARHPDDVWAANYTATSNNELWCPSWKYESPYAPFDPNANASGELGQYSNGQSTEGGRKIASDGHSYFGNVFGGGSGSVPYFDTTAGISKYLSSAGTVEGNTHVTISGGHVLTSVYGGCETTNVKGTAYVTMTGGTIGVPRTDTQIQNHPVIGYLFGAGKGDQRIFFNKETNVNDAVVKVEGGRIYGSVYGGGEDGHVFRNVELTIGKADHTGPTIGTKGTSYYDGHVFGGGRGFGGEALTAGNVGGAVDVKIDGGSVLGSVYGGGRLASVGYGLYLTTENGYGVMREDNQYDGSYTNPSTLEASEYYTKGRGYITVDINGGTIGNDDANDNYGGNVYGGSMGRHTKLDGTEFPESHWSLLATAKQTIVNVTGGTINRSVYGGGEAGPVRNNVTVNVDGGSIMQDVYGGGALANTNVANWNATANTWAEGKTSASYTTAVNLHGGTIGRNVYGGGLGKMAVGTPNTEGYVPGVEAKVYGNTAVELNGKVVVVDAVNTYPDDCVVKGNIFGCNNLNGSPQGTTTVHIYKTQDWDGHTKTAAASLDDPDDSHHTYNVAAVYGGGNLAAYKPVDLANATTNVIIDGCGLTSIKQVYAGGNAASVPASKVTVNATYEIEEVFGGGNGKDDIVINNETKPNPGANVGFYDYSAVEATYPTKQARQVDAFVNTYTYGTGKAAVNIFGGTIHRVFGGSNTKGNVRQSAITMLEDAEVCAFCVDEAYGGGKSAPMDAEAKLLMACIPGLREVYGGAEAADVYDDVTVTITNGTFDRVFGGNNLSGTIRGKITVNVEETGCRPVIIGELYGGGNLAGYSVYGYKEVTEGEGTEAKTVWKPRESATDAGTGPATPYADPVVNVKSFTSIGNVYGGGYGAGALMVGNPTVNINESVGTPTNYPTTGTDYDTNGFKGKTITVAGHEVTLPSHKKGKIGAINNVFGGGNAAKVIGNTNVNIGTEATQTYISIDDDPATEANDKVKTVTGADIRGNVYGGGNNAEVTGNTNVNIGKKEGE